MKSDFSVMKEVAVHTRISPAARQQSLNNFLKRVRDSKEASDLLSSWGLSLARDAVAFQVNTLISFRLQ
jgi:aubergine-like protein